MGEREGVNEHGKDLPAGHDADREGELERVPACAVYHDFEPNGIRSRPSGPGCWVPFPFDVLRFRGNFRNKLIGS